MEVLIGECMGIKKQQEMIDILSSLCEELGWVIGILADDSESTADGLIIGPEAFVYKNLAMYEEEYDVVTQNMGEERMTELSSSTPNKKKILH